MLRSYFTIAWRNLLRYKIYSAINVVGLAIGMTACLLMMLFVGYEWGFDRMHRKNVFRLCEVQKFEGMVLPQKVPLTAFAMGPALNADFPQVANATHFIANGNVLLHHGQKHIPIPGSFFADTSFLQVFDFRLLSGDPKTALAEPGSVVLTQETAQKFFGAADAIGRTVLFYGRDTMAFKVTGVLENVPAQSHLQFDALLSIATMQQPAMLKDWSNHFARTYVELAPGTDAGALERKLPAFLRKYMGKDVAKSFELFLQPLREVHGGSADITHDSNNHRKFERRYTYLFVALALAVLGIAVLNFINLSTARAAQRAKEIGIRKAVGAFRMQIAAQFVGESVLLSGLALMLALVLVYLALPPARTLSERDLQLPLLANPWLVPVVLAATVGVGVLSGLYPAAFLSAFGPAQVLKGGVPGAGKKATFRSLLVVGQFAAGILLLIGTIVSTRQVRYMLHRDPGFDREQVMVLTMDMDGYQQAGQQYQTLRQELLRQPGVTGVTASGQRLGNNLRQTEAAFRGDGPLRKLSISQLVADPNYLTFYRIALVAGRGFSPAQAAGSRKEYVINESLARELLGNTPGRPFGTLIGKPFGFGADDADGTIVGIVRDFHFNSLHHKVETLAIAAAANVGYGEVSVRVEAGQAPAAIRRAEALWRRLVPTQPFEYAFLDDHFGQLYRADAQVSQVVALLAGLAVLIACLGLFGLALYTTQRRTKEIGIRKVFGASVGSLVALLSGDFLKLVVVAFLLAAPVAWWTLRAWLDQFAYRIHVGWWPFALAGLLAIGVAWLTVAFQSIRAARTNPVKSLRSE